ncbi:MAG: putative biosis protein MshI [Moraxellaceae bacterium]|jgi:MSHA biogenesis protein MshI|nr:putative biosis protein MshI [Moraxellaceae bacterium]
MISSSSSYWQRWLPCWKGRLKKTGAKLGLLVGNASIAWARVETRGDTLAVKAFGCLQAESPDAVWARFRNVVTLEKLQGLPLHVVMGLADYQLLLMESPEVPAEELREAMRWRLGDFISFPVTDAAIDVFTLPEDAYRGRQRMLYTAVCQQRQIETLRLRADSLRLSLASVTIPEIALSRLEPHLLAGEDSTALLQFTESGSLLGIFQDHALYLARQTPFSLQTLDTAQYDNVLLKIQRSLDYFDSQIGKGMVKRLLITPFPGVEALARHLAGNLDVAVQLLDLSPLWPAPGVTGKPDDIAPCLLAIGAVMGGEA